MANSGLNNPQAWWEMTYRWIASAQPHLWADQDTLSSRSIWRFNMAPHPACLRPNSKTELVGKSPLQCGHVGRLIGGSERTLGRGRHYRLSQGHSGRLAHGQDQANLLRSILAVPCLLCPSEDVGVSKSYSEHASRRSVRGRNCDVAMLERPMSKSGTSGVDESWTAGNLSA
jgi:hypothetical protein